MRSLVLLTCLLVPLNARASAQLSVGIEPRRITVTNIGDGGAGSLRQAIIESQVLCADVPCVIEFRIPPPVPEQGWFTIEPLSPLPDLMGSVTIDGATQTSLSGDTNANGPEIEINGARVQGGSDGLRLRDGCDLRVLDIAINAFPGHGIDVEQSAQSFKQCGNNLAAVPIRIQRTSLEKNFRGVFLNGGNTFIEDSAMTDNARSAIFAWSGFYVGIRRNRLLRNGASGVYLNVGNQQFGIVAGGADIEENVIANNGHWGICRTRNGEISITRNSIHDNTLLGIDVDLDLETPNRQNDSPGIPNRPTLFSAFYDSLTGQTIVRGELNSEGSFGHGVSFRIDFYVSSTLSQWGRAEGETFILSRALSVGRSTFEVSFPGDFRSKFITATTNRTHIVGLLRAGPASQLSAPTDTSEFSNAIEVR